MNDKLLTWEEAVQWLKSQPDWQELVKACYYDEHLIDAAKRFAASEEWQAVQDIVKHMLPCKILDLGAGNGISSYAFASLGCEVTSVEPDPSNIVGAGAIIKLAKEFNLNIEVVQNFGETLSFADSTFDIVYGRQVLHHANNLGQLCQEASRVLRAGGMLIATREHVISRQADLDVFLRSHPLHDLYGGENAFMLADYRRSILNAGLIIKHIYRPLESVINYAPLTSAQYKFKLSTRLSKFVGGSTAQWLVSQPFIISLWGRIHAWRDHTPGRLYSFIAIKS
ncbi:Glycine/sarcosine/dimethylglycine N-methyltransferase [Tumidithrix helvetica PCC 7403]|uniref:class I SAM-dependent methyltransferase n=1 Tax=Tumidithrix helvetica TaxID=3457545 RepID=UPI003CBA499D